MADTSNPAVTVEAVATVGVPAPVDASAQAGSTPSQPTVEAVGAHGNDVAQLKAQAEESAKRAAAAEAKAAAAEAEAKKAFQARDTAKQRFLESPEGQSIKAELDAAKQRVAEFEKAKKDAEEAEALKRGEFQKVAEQRAAERDAALAKVAEYQAKVAEAEKSAETKITEAAQKQRAEKVRQTLDAFYTAAGGTNAELFQIVSDRLIADGSVKYSDDGASIVGVPEAIKKIAEAYPPLFKSPQDVLKRVAAAIPGGVGASQAAFAIRDQKQRQQQHPEGQPFPTLADSYALEAGASPHWRHAKSKQQ